MHLQFSLRLEMLIRLIDANEWINYGVLINGHLHIGAFKTFARSHL